MAAELIPLAPATVLALAGAPEVISSPTALCGARLTRADLEAWVGGPVRWGHYKREGVFEHAFNPPARLIPNLPAAPPREPGPPPETGR